MKKRISKERRIELEKDALRRRLLDMACGADGGDMRETLAIGELFVSEAVSRWLAAIRDVLLGGPEGKWEYLVGAHCVGRFASIDEAVQHLYESGVRADESHLEEKES